MRVGAWCRPPSSFSDSRSGNGTPSVLSVTAITRHLDSCPSIYTLSPQHLSLDEGLRFEVRALRSPGRGFRRRCSLGVAPRWLCCCCCSLLLQDVDHVTPAPLIRCPHLLLPLHPRSFSRRGATSFVISVGVQFFFTAALSFLFFCCCCWDK